MCGEKPPFEGQKRVLRKGTPGLTASREFVIDLFLE